VPYLIEGAVDTAVGVACLEQRSEQLEKKAVVLIDNAPVHRSQEFIRHIPTWVQKGVIIKY
jgi:hypothetical protein